MTPARTNVPQECDATPASDDELRAMLRGLITRPGALASMAAVLTDPSHPHHAEAVALAGAHPAYRDALLTAHPEVRPILAPI